MMRQMAQCLAVLLVEGTGCEAFDIQNISGLYNEQKITLSNPEQVKAAYSKAAKGLLVSGNSTDVADNTFTFADEFDFSGGTIGRVDVDALSVKGTKAKLEFYLEEIKKIEKCFSKNNPWIEMFSEMVIPEEITRPDVKRWIDRVESFRYEKIEVQFKNREWKEMLPEEWFEEA